MEIILLERVPHLGQMGDVVKVKPGYARNYLLPKNKAVRATEENRKRFDARRAQLEAQNLERRAEAEKVALRMRGLSVVLIRQAGEMGQLYGSVTARDIADAVTAAGFTILRQQLILDQPIKSLGIHTVAVRLHPEVTEPVRVNVARSADEAEMQAKSGRAMVGAPEEREAMQLRQEAEEIFDEEALARDLDESAADREPAAADKG